MTIGQVWDAYQPLFWLGFIVALTLGLLFVRP